MLPATAFNNQGINHQYHGAGRGHGGRSTRFGNPMATYFTMNGRNGTSETCQRQKDTVSAEVDFRTPKLSRNGVCHVAKANSWSECHASQLNVDESITDMFYSDPLNVDGIELPPLPLGLPQPEKIGSHHFDSLLAAPKNQCHPNGTKRVDPFDVFHIRGNPYDIVGVDEIYKVQEAEEEVEPLPSFKKEEVPKEEALPKEIKKAATLLVINRIQGHGAQESVDRLRRQWIRQDPCPSPMLTSWSFSGITKATGYRQHSSWHLYI